MDDQMESVHTLSSRFEADLLMDALEREDVRALLRTFEETPYDGLFVMQRGWGQILVPREQVELARQIIQPLVQDLAAKKLYDDPADVDPQLWEALRRADPEIISRNAQVRYDMASSAYIVPMLNGEFGCFPEEERISSLRPDTSVKINFQFYLTVLHYLLEAQSEGLAGKWVSEQEIPGGSLFFRGPHAFQTQPLEQFYGERLELFSAAAERLGGVQVTGGDRAYRFWVLPRIPLLFVLWKGDDEFPASVNVRFDTTIHHQLHTLDTIWAMVNLVCRALLRAGKTELDREE